LTIERVRLQRRTLGTLMASHVVGYAAQASAVAVVALLAAELLGSDTVAGLPSAMGTLGAAVFAPFIARVALRRGRRRALSLGLLGGSLGGLATATAGQFRSLVLLAAGMFVFGAGQAANLQSRFAATDLAPPARRARALSLVVWVATVGAVSGPALYGLEESWGIERGFNSYVGPMLIGGILYLLASALVFTFLRPDPLEVAGGIDPQASPGHPLGAVWSTLRTLLKIPPARLALASMTVSQAAMVGVMTMTPLHLKDHGQAELSGLVISLHVLGMFGLSPLIGAWSDRFGRIPIIAAGALVLGGGTAAAVVAGYHPGLIFAGLFLLGLGWSLGVISGSALLTESVPDDMRIPAQGTGDLLMAGLGAVAAFGSGFVKQTVGYHWLANAATTVALLLVVAAIATVRNRKEVPAHVIT
jgi:MFS family permease